MQSLREFEVNMHVQSHELKVIYLANNDNSFRHSLKSEVHMFCFSFFLEDYIQGGISSSVLSVFFTDKFALSQSDARISVAYNSCQ